MIKTEMTCIRGKNGDEDKYVYNCGICSRLFRYGPHVYLGQPVKDWDIMACRSCIKSNHDGIVAATHPELVEHLKDCGVEIRFYANGHIAWPENSGLRFF